MSLKAVVFPVINRGAPGSAPLKKWVLFNAVKLWMKRTRK